MTETDDFNPGCDEPLLIVISGLSGSGKDTVIAKMSERRLPFKFVVTATTRPPRPNEQHGIDYIFISKDRFSEMLAKDELVEHAVVYEDYYGIPKEQVDRATQSGQDVVIRVDVQGAAKIRQLYPQAVLIFLTAESEEALIKRLKQRRSEEPEKLKLRISTAYWELKRKDEFDYVVVNRDNQLEETVDVILAIIEAEHHRTTHRKVTP